MNFYFPAHKEAVCTLPCVCALSCSVKSNSTIPCACVCVCAQLLSQVQLFVTPWTAACQAPLSK